ncbi:hypothetical protein IC582_008324 [Cucumis melo]
MAMQNLHLCDVNNVGISFIKQKGNFNFSFPLLSPHFLLLLTNSSTPSSLFEKQ